MADDDEWGPWSARLAHAHRVGSIDDVRAVLDDLWRFDFHGHRARDPERWDALYAILTDLLRAGDADLRGAARHYAFVLLGVELGPPYSSHTADERRAGLARRLGDLLPALEALVRDGATSLLAVVDDIVHVEGLAETGPSAPVRRWLEAVPVPDATRRAAEIAYLDARAPWTTVRDLLVGALDHPDVLVRAVAARTIGRRYLEGTGGEPDEPFSRVVRTITDRELERPGIAGPLCSAWYSAHIAEFAARAHVTIEHWLAEILAGRCGPEPDTLPCSNGIDFFAHEVFGGRADWIRKISTMGHARLAAEAATEIDDRIDDLEPILRELADHEDDAIARAAAWHLADHHRVSHGGAARRGFVHRFALAQAEVFVTLRGPAGAENSACAATLYPIDSDTFDDAVAAAALDRVLPTALRGEPVAFGRPGDGGEPADRVDGSTVSTRYRNGAIVTRRGDVAARRWSRIRITWRGPAGAWRPGDGPVPGPGA